MWQEFKTFLVKQNALALAIAVVVGGALDTVVKSIVDGLIMPIVAAASPNPESYQDLTWQLGPLALKPGLVLAAVLNFLIVGFVAWRLSKLFIREAPAAAAKAVKSCPYCFMGDLDVLATRCPHCTSALGEVPSYSPSAGGVGARGMSPA